MTTRLIVKSLPANCTEASLRKFFKKYGTLSDCTLKYTKEGKFRKFAFVGFDSEENAKKALQETHQSFMGSSRLQVMKLAPRDMLLYSLTMFLTGRRMQTFR